MNITLNIDEDIVEKVRKIAIDKDTTLTAMVREYLSWVATSGTTEREAHLVRLEDSFRRVSRDMGTRKWNREDLHAR